MLILKFIFLLTIGYLMGSICSAVIVSKLFQLPDPRTDGSKNPGATNVLRLSGKKYAVLVLIMDMLKGVVPVLIGKILGADITLLALTGLAAVLGHIYPLFFSFQGGKGVATALGALLGFQPLLGLICLIIWLLTALIWRYSSLASLFSIGLAPLVSIFTLGNLSAFTPLFLLAIVIIYKHKDNIVKLTEGRESKIQLTKR